MATTIITFFATTNPKKKRKEGKITFKVLL
jgi:hypothetical protein